MPCPRCQHENRPQARFCEECARPLKPASPTAQPGADPKSEVEGFKRALTESLEQQTATAEILRVISSSPTDVQPVFAAVLRSAARLCDAFDATIFQVDGDGLRLVAHEGPILSHPVGEFPLIRGLTAGRAVLDRRTIHVPDVQAEVDEYPDSSSFARTFGVRTTLSVPLLRGTEAIGAIAIRRTEVRPFTDRQIELLQIFAAQAVIAIENVRLFQELQARNRELTGALERETATKEVLETISRSTFDLPSILTTLIERATRLCRAEHGTILRVEGEFLRLEADNGGSPEFREFRRQNPIPVGPGSVSGRVVAGGRTIHVHDVLADPDYRESEVQRITGVRTLLGVPMLREGQAIGVITLRRTRVEPFDEREIALVTTFADQALIAIENARLLKDLQARNTELAESLKQQTATADILRVISSSLTDVQPVFDTIAEHAVRLCDGLFSSVVRFDGELIHLVAHRVPPDAIDEYRRAFPGPLSHDTLVSRAVLECAVVQVRDATNEEEVPLASRRLLRAVEVRSALAVPMVRGGNAVGAIGVSRGTLNDQARPFSDNEIQLLKTFADQAVIAIENVRLFNETREALEQQTATAEILRVISSSPTDLQPVMEAVVENAARVCGALDSAIFRLEGEHLRLVARHGPLRTSFAIGESVPVRRDRVGGRAVLDRRTIQVEDIRAAEAEFPETASRAKARGSTVRTMVGTPLLREGIPLGVLFVNRGPEPTPFSAKQIALLETFANQAVIAIENVRLFTELQEKNRALTEAHAQVTESLEQQTATSEILRIIASSPTDLQPVLDAVVASAARVCGADDVVLARIDGDTLRPVAGVGPAPKLTSQEGYPASRGSVAGRAVQERRTVHVHDLAAESDSEYPVAKARQRVTASEPCLATPLLREGSAIGAFVLRRMEVRPFTEKEIELLETFADQAVIAIENVRLFTELGARNRDLTEALEQQTATSEVLRVISSSPTDIQPVFDNDRQERRQAVRSRS